MCHAYKKLLLTHKTEFKCTNADGLNIQPLKEAVTPVAAHSSTAIQLIVHTGIFTRYLKMWTTSSLGIMNQKPPIVIAWHLRMFVMQSGKASLSWSSVSHFGQQQTWP